MNTYTYKVVLIGDAGVGKTSIRSVFAGKKFRKTYLMTIGVEIALKTFEVKDPSTRESFGEVSFLIWDLGGQLKFTRVRESYYAGSSGALLVYDITDRRSFENLNYWVEELLESRGRIPLVIVGNKIDLRREVEDYIKVEDAIPKIRSLERIYGRPIRFIETSAKENINIYNAFNILAIDILNEEEI
ncbi:MAG: Rab family GTPase [Candidatus Asgardarchaeia archaeon]